MVVIKGSKVLREHQKRMKRKRNTSLIKKLVSLFVTFN